MTGTLKPTTPSSEEYAQAAELREAIRAFQRRSEEIASTHGLTARTYQLLLMTKTARDGSGRISLAELEERLHLGKSTVTELVLRTEKRGLVRRELDRARGRGIAISLTPKGARSLAKAVAEHGGERRELIELLSTLAE